MYYTPYYYAYYSYAKSPNDFTYMNTDDYCPSYNASLFQCASTNGYQYFIDDFCPSQPYVDEYLSSQYCLATNSHYYDKRFYCSSGSSKASPIGAIVGGTIGGLAALIFSVWGL